jgi:hypothetical protein
MGDQPGALAAGQVGVLYVRVQVMRDSLGADVDDESSRIRSRVASYLESLALPQRLGTPDERCWAKARRVGCLKDLQAQLGRKPTLEDLEAHLPVAAPLDAQLRGFVRRDLERGV